MEDKYKRYQNFDWTLDQRWQNYYNNIFPIPARDRLDRIKKRWYKENVDRDFDVNYQPNT